MRGVLLGVLMVIVWLVGATPALPQGKDKKEPDKKDLKKDDKKPPKITEIGGRSLDDWIKDISGKDRSKTAIAIETILRFGPDQAKKAIPALLTELRKHKPGTTTVDMSVRINACQALAVILTNIEDPDDADVKEAVRLMTSFLKDEQRIIKHRICQALAQMGPWAQSAISELIKTTTDFPTWQTRHAAVLALGRIAPPYDEKEKTSPPRPVLTALYDALRDSASQVRLAALQSLDSLNVPDIKTEKFVLEDKVEKLAYGDTELVVRIKAHLLLFSIQPKLKSKRCSSIGTLLKHAETPVRVEAAQALGNIGPEAKEQVSNLMAALEDKDQIVVLWVIWALGEIGASASPALSALDGIAKDSKHPLHKAAEDAVEKIKKK